MLDFLNKMHPDLFCGNSRDICRAIEYHKGQKKVISSPFWSHICASMVKCCIQFHPQFYLAVFFLSFLHFFHPFLLSFVFLSPFCSIHESVTSIFIFKMGCNALKGWEKRRKGTTGENKAFF